MILASHPLPWVDHGKFENWNKNMSIDKETARRAAHLARIEVADEDLEKLAGELT